MKPRERILKRDTDKGLNISMYNHESDKMGLQWADSEG